jgi:hypothetical protein
MYGDDFNYRRLSYPNIHNLRPYADLGDSFDDYDDYNDYRHIRPRINYAFQSNVKLTFHDEIL